MLNGYQSVQEKYQLVRSFCWKYLNVAQWTEIKPYFEFTFERKLFARFWTTADIMQNYSYSHSLRNKYFSAKLHFIQNLQSETNFNDLNEKFQKLSIRKIEKQGDQKKSDIGKRQRSREKLPKPLRVKVCLKDEQYKGINNYLFQYYSIVYSDDYAPQTSFKNGEKVNGKRRKNRNKSFSPNWREDYVKDEEKRKNNNKHQQLNSRIHQNFINNGKQSFIESFQQ